MVCARLKIDFVEDLERLATCVSKKFADLGVHVLGETTNARVGIRSAR